MEMDEIDQRIEDIHGFACKSCLKTFRYQLMLNKHNDLHHFDCEKTKKFHCEKCSQSFDFETNLRRHSIFEHNEFEVITVSVEYPDDEQKSFPCSLCQKSFKHVGELNAHIELTHPSSDGEKKTFSCGVSFSDENGHELQVQVHANHEVVLEETPQQSMENFICSTCSESFDEYFNLWQHINAGHKSASVVREKSPPVETSRKHRCLNRCKYCSKVFRFHKSGLMRHIDFKHQREDTEERSYKCANCPQAFHLKKSLERHLWSEHRGESNDKSKSNKSRRLREADKQIETRTVQNSGSEDHEDLSHVDDSQREENNNVSVGANSNLKKNYERVRGDREENLIKRKLLKRRRFKCPKCPRKFFRMFDLQKHCKLLHVAPVIGSLGNYKCKYCTKICYHKSGLMRHVDFKHPLEGIEDRIHRCGICSCAFHLKECLDRHIRSQHRSKMGRPKLKANTPPIDKRTMENSLHGKSKENDVELHTEQGFEQHQEFAHPRMIKATKAHKCRTCTRSFNFRSILKHHQQTCE